MAPQKLDDDMPKIMLEKDDRDAYRRQRGGSHYSPTTSSETNKNESEKTSGGSVFVTFLLFLISLAACGASYYLYDLGLKQDALMQSAEERILNLEDRLSATGEETGNSMVALQVKVKELTEKTDELWKQMDKLWESAWRRNQKEIGDLNKSLSTELGKVTQQLKSISSDLAINSTATNVLQEQVELSNDKQARFDEKFSEQLQKLSSFDQQNVTLQQRIEATAKANREMSVKLNAMIKKQAELERALSQKATKSSPVQSLPNPNG